jgi:hypothetical protein
MTTVDMPSRARALDEFGQARETAEATCGGPVTVLHRKNLRIVALLHGHLSEYCPLYLACGLLPECC